jgi:hypothetical protein
VDLTHALTSLIGSALLVAYDRARFFLMTFVVFYLANPDLYEKTRLTTDELEQHILSDH